MIERCKKGKIWYRSVCTLLSVALCVCMLSGCRSRQESASVGTKTAQTYADTENGEITTDETESQDGRLQRKQSQTRLIKQTMS